MSLNNTDFNWDGKVLLIAEDEDFNYLFLEEVLITTKARLIRAHDGVQTIDLFKSNPRIDLILMDMQMPVMSGYQATQAIKNLNPKVPVIAQTAYSYSEAYQQIKDAGCDDFVTKPIDILTLKKTIHKYLFP